MVIVNQANISNNGLSLDININTAEGYTIQTIKAWTQDGFKEESEAIDLEYKLIQINNKEIFSISPEEMNLNRFEGIYFLEFTSNYTGEEGEDCDECGNPVLVVVSNMDSYYKCATEAILKIDLCSNNLFSKEVCDSNYVNKAITINLLIDAVNQCLELGQLTEAIDLMKYLKKSCKGCTSCEDYLKTTECKTCKNYTY